MAERAIVATDDRKFEIPVLGRQQVDQILELRMLLEGLAAAQAAARITEPELQRIRKQFTAMDDAVQQLDSELLLETNTRFHFLIYRASRNEILMAIIESLWLQYAPTISDYLPELIRRLSLQDRQKLYQVSQEQHARILAALENKDSDEAREQIHADLKIFRDAGEATGHHIAADHHKHRTIADYVDLLPDEDKGWRRALTD